MPPKAKFSKEQIINSALKIIETDGFEKLTARSLAEKLNSSTKPIFQYFKNMDELIEETWKTARENFQNFTDDFPENGIDETIAGRKYILFAQEKPHLFKFIFLQNQEISETFEDLMRKIDIYYDESLNKICEFYKFTKEKAEFFLKSMWVYSHGIACYCAFNQSRFTNQEINNLLEQAGSAIIQKLSQPEK